MQKDITSDLNLEQEFTPPTWEEWLASVPETLKGADFDKAMKTNTYEGITLSPIYRKEDLARIQYLESLPGEAPYVRGTSPNGYLEDGWYVAQLQDNPNLEELNKELLDELNRGLSALNLQLHPATLQGSIPDADTDRGLPLSCLSDLICLLDKIDLSAVPVYLNSGSISVACLGLLNAYIKEKGYNLRSIKASVMFDPIAEYASNGKLPLDFDSIWQMMYQMVFWADLKAPNIKTICLDGSAYEKAGASTVQELGIILATAIGYIKGLLDSGLSIEQIAPRFQLNLSLGSNFFMEIAKIRAARLLWSNMIKAFGGSPEAQKIFVHGVTAKFNKSIYDPWVNVLRTSTEAFAAVIGGVDSLDVSTYNELTSAREPFSKRIARNQQIILREEAHFDRVVDPSGGCYYIEALTSEIADQAWKVMQQIESHGGMLKALEAGNIQIMIDEIATSRTANVDKRRDVFVGVNMYSNPDEAPLATAPTTTEWLNVSQKRLAATRSGNGKDESLAYLSENLSNDYLVDMITDAWMHGANISEISSALGFGEGAGLKSGKLTSRRAMQNIETLRQDVQNSPANKSIFMCNIGKLAQIKPRVDFSVGFLQVAGFNVINSGAYDDVQTALEAYQASEAKALCICAGDDTYLTIVEEICQKSGTSVIILAGYPANMVETYQNQGVKVFIHLKANTYSTLKQIAQMMEVVK